MKKTVYDYIRQPQADWEAGKITEGGEPGALNGPYADTIFPDSGLTLKIAAAHGKTRNCKEIKSWDAK